MDQILGRSSDDRLAKPIHGGHPLTTAERQTSDLSSTINGGGSDLDPAVRPGVPRDKAPEIGAESLYIDVQQQVPRHRIF